MSTTFLFEVADAFQISGRGCVLAPGIPTDHQIQTIRIGDPIRLVKPNGEMIDTTIHGFEMLNYGHRRPEKFFAPISLPKEITKHDVPAGTEVFLLSQESGGGNGA